MEVRDLISLEGITRLIISVAFLNHRGLDLISDLLGSVAAKSVLIVGVRNGVTTVQGLRAAVNLGCRTYAIDTGSMSVLYHPKVYLSKNNNEARILLGSANLTFGGLWSNFEASLKLILDRSVNDDEELLNDIESRTLGIITEFPSNVIELSTENTVSELYEAGHLVDETARRIPVTSGNSTTNTIYSVPKITIEPIESSSSFPLSQAADDPHLLEIPHATPAGIGEKPNLVWKSRPLTRRDLNIPTGSNTNPTGSMLFKKGTLTNIDHRSYFRNTVFSNLVWINDSDPRTEHMERTEARFNIVIRNVEYGPYVLRISHNSRTDSQTYRQNNSMTQLHWGEARSLIQKEELIGSTAYLYKSYEELRHYVLEID